MILCKHPENTSIVIHILNISYEYEQFAQKKKKNLNSKLKIRVYGNYFGVESRITAGT